MVSMVLAFSPMGILMFKGQLPGISGCSLIKIPLLKGHHQLKLNLRWCNVRQPSDHRS
uniref:Uncharacterized protein n=1 Tax=Arundo donax TaxID=35708 RepID=A0A0A8ZMW3_ARUDO